MVEFRDLAVSFILIGIVTFAFIAWAIQIQSDNNAADRLSSNSEIGRMYGNIGEELNKSQDSAQGQKVAQEQETPTLSATSLIYYTITKAPQVIGETITGVYNTLIGGASRIIGVNKTILAGFTAILLITIIFLVWSLVRAGR